MTVPRERVFTVNDLPLAELYGARLDGQVFQLADSWCVIDEIDGCSSRAVAASQLVPPRAIAERLTAAWIYGVAPEPRRHQFCVVIGARTTALWSPRAQVREIVRTPEDVHTIAGVRITTPLRTAVDLARYTPPSASSASSSSNELTALLARLLHYGTYADVTDAVHLCKRGSAAHSTLAVARFAAVSAPLSALRQRTDPSSRPVPPVSRR
ncbi:type IV toxin-antitoxin system AbiEi family antitoxin [Cryobacterium sp. PH31-O1]|uniref:type IV toxin-antitoxin system AbiEi family antitoxin n=1 Tax=Cryobacterium sp. PH31-O1 TaxID=3046306 RepID=UPI0024BAB61A|nr:type IV toxin-antitoxin system AbiEi family antitoxin [Cryobacterium sp. PH31-O1]MDJ0336960.1 type IV toxin-antitoxin system AbiEi family antitoxin [Cryobacterium sp. PH31-O1]